MVPVEKSNQKSNMNIVLAANQKFAFATRVCIASILQNNKGINIYLLYSDIDERDLLELHRLIKSLDQSSNFFPKFIDSSLFDGMPTSTVITRETYYRLLILQLLPDEDRALYLDTDTIVLKPIDRLYHISLGDNYAAAVEDWGMIRKPNVRNDVFKKLGFNNNDIYYNAGVWLFNLKLIREHFKPEYLLNYLHENVEKITFHDQDVLNCCFHGKILSIDSVYNCRSYLFGMKDEPYILNNVYIIHYGPKPWDDGFVGICGDAFWDVAKSIGYFDEYRKYKRKQQKRIASMRYRELKKYIKKVIKKY